MTAAVAIQADRQALIDHLDTRFANGAIERALGGFALMFVSFQLTSQNGESPEPLVGKSALAAISTRLRTTLRDSDFLALYDERTFAVVIPQISDRATAERITQKLQAAFGRPIGYPDADSEGVLPIKIGFSLFPADGTTRESLIAHAQRAI